MLLVQKAVGNQVVVAVGRQVVVGEAVGRPVVVGEAVGKQAVAQLAWVVAGQC